MQIFHHSPSELAEADPKNFCGSARVLRLVASNDPHVVTFRVEFEPSARTNWHVHEFVQMLFFIEGRGRLQKWGGPVQELSAGDTAIIEPGEKHWHGAATDAAMVHLAVNLGSSTIWMEPVDLTREG